MLSLGSSSTMIQTRRELGTLASIHRGVYAVGHSRLTREGRWMAAVLAGGPTAVLSHVSAAMHWGIVPLFPSLPSVTIAGKGRRRPGIDWHSARLAGDEVTTRDGIPVTTAARTLLDLAAVVEPFRLERALAEAEFRRLADSTPLSALLERHRGARGTAVLGRLLTAGAATAGITRSELESSFLAFVDQRSLPRPELNQPLRIGESFVEVDCLWRRQRVALELDGRASHERKAQFDSDRERDRRLLVYNWQPVRVGREHIAGRGAADRLALDLSRLLAPR